MAIPDPLPIPGDRVHYMLPELYKGAGEIRAAEVVRSIEGIDGRVNLIVSCDVGDRGDGRIHFQIAGVRYDARGVQGCWSWPPRACR